jgi:hypothetical protein
VGDERNKVGDVRGHRGGKLRLVCLPGADEPKIGCKQAQAACVRRYRSHPAVVETDPERRHHLMRDTQAEERHRSRSISRKPFVDTRKESRFAVIELEFATRLANRAPSGQVDAEEKVVLTAGIIRAANLK